jgi:hypothetical protein
MKKKAIKTVTTGPQSAGDYREIAERARRLALVTTDNATAEYMAGEAADCDETADHMDEAALAATKPVV